MYANEIKLAKKLIKKKQERDGILLLLKTLIRFDDNEKRSTKEYQEAGQLFANILLLKKNRTIIYEFIKTVSQSSVVFLINIAVEFGQLKAAILALEELFPLEVLELETLNFYLDILDSNMEREKALRVALDYLGAHPELSLGSLKSGDIVNAWENDRSREVAGQTAASDQDLELFSLLFKLIKILYCEGQLVKTEILVRTLEPMANANQDLQTSKIKNSYNYFQYIAKLLPLKNYKLDATNPIYIVGDSHCLSPAWDTIQLDSNYYIKPLLVTGCKIWHLRDKSFFHAKTNFYRAVERIPRGSAAIFIFGEIDCREGILSALRKGEYASAEKAIELLINLYIKRIQEVIKARDLARVYVHQVPPVLDATRGIVRQFNKLLEEKIRALGNKRLVWLGFKDDLLTENGEFNSKYDLDETHLHPDYIHTALIEQARHEK